MMRRPAFSQSLSLLALAAASRAVTSPIKTPTLQSLEPITRGGLVVVRDWLPPELTAALRADGQSLLASGQFASSGLSNTAKGARQGFGSGDRSVCAIKPGLGGDTSARADFQRRLELVRGLLERDGRPGLVCAEQYYSHSGLGASLARHMDERHEELKAYLCEDGWNEPGGSGAGGQLRAFCRDTVAAGGTACGAHEGNLQVAWRASGQDGRGPEEPVFLDAWVPTEVRGYSALPPADQQTTPRYLSLAALYRVGASGQREYISTGVEGGGPHTLAELVQTLSADERRRLSMVEVGAAARGPPAGSSEQLVVPKGSTLLLFDSVAVPHEVLETTKGERWAMAGWFHEPSQPVPKWLGAVA